MKLNLLATTAAAALLASSGMWAQAQAPGANEHKAQAHEQKAQARDQKGAAEFRAATQDRGEGKQLQTKDTAAETGKPGAQHAEDAQQKGKSGRDQMNAKKDDAKTDAPKAAERQDQKKPESAAQNENRKTGADQKSASDTKGKADQNRMNKADAAKAGKNDKKDQSKSAEQKAGDQKADQSKQAEKKDNTKSNTAATDPKAGNTNSQASQANNKNAAQNGNKNAAQNQNAQKNQPASQSASQQTSQPGNQQTGAREQASTKLSETDKTKVFSTLKSNKQVSNQRIDVSVNVGQRLPARVHARPLPRTVVEVMPQYRGYDYVMVRDEIAIVRPGTREVVDVIQQPGSSTSVASMTTHQGSTTIHLTDTQRDTLRKEATRFKTSQVSGAGPQCLTLQPVPSSIANDNPDLKKYQMLAIGDDIVLVDPDQKKVVDVIQ
jgi:hypothetical protein